MTKLTLLIAALTFVAFGCNQQKDAKNSDNKRKGDSSPQETGRPVSANVKTIESDLLDRWRTDPPSYARLIFNDAAVKKKSPGVVKQDKETTERVTGIATWLGMVTKSIVPGDNETIVLIPYNDPALGYMIVNGFHESDGKLVDLEEMIKNIELGSRVIVRRNMDIKNQFSLIDGKGNLAIMAFGNGLTLFPVPKPLIELAKSISDSPLAPKDELRGKNEIRVNNSMEVGVTLSFRFAEMPDKHKIIYLPAMSKASVFVPDGDCKPYFVFSDDSDALFEGDDLDLQARGVEISLLANREGGFKN